MPFICSLWLSYFVVFSIAQNYESREKTVEFANDETSPFTDKYCGENVRKVFCEICNCSLAETEITIAKCGSEHFEANFTEISNIGPEKRSYGLATVGYLCHIKVLDVWNDGKMEHKLHPTAFQISTDLMHLLRKEKHPALPEIFIKGALSCSCSNLWLHGKKVLSGRTVFRSHRLPKKLISCINSGECDRIYRKYSHDLIPNMSGFLALSLSTLEEGCTSEVLETLQRQCPREIQPTIHMDAEKYRCSVSASSEGCLHTYFHPYGHYQTLAMIGENTPIQSCQKILEIPIAQLIISGWLECRFTPNSDNFQAPQSVLSDVRIEDSAPTFFDVEQAENHGNTYVRLRLSGQLDSKPDSLKWWYWSRIGSWSEFWRIQPNENQFFHLHKDESSEPWEDIWSGFTISNYIASFVTPHKNCIFGVYTVEGCRKATDFYDLKTRKFCTSTSFKILENSLPTACARKNVTFSVEESYSMFVQLSEVTDEYRRKFQLLPAVIQHNIHFFNDSHQIPELGSTKNVTLNISFVTNEEIAESSLVRDQITQILLVFGLSTLAAATILGCTYVCCTGTVIGHTNPGTSIIELQSLNPNNIAWSENSAYTSWISNLGDADEIPTVSLEELEATEELGEGAFGKVFLVSHRERGCTNLAANLKTSLIAESGSVLAALPEKMALKMVKFATPQRVMDLKREAVVLTTLSHPNIVKFFAISHENPDSPSTSFKHVNFGKDGNFPGVGLLFEFMEHGSLIEYIRARNPTESDHIEPPLTTRDHLEISLQIAGGLQYLSSRQLVHRDLAARNCLVTADSVVKISDFGMTRDICATNYYKMDKETLVPLRWLPPESLLYRKFTIESDVWSFGVLLWEVFSYGRVPWYMYSNYEVIDVIKSGRLLERTEQCPTLVYSDLMLPCWKVDPKERITAEAAKETLRKLLNDEGSLWPERGQNLIT